MDIDDQRFYFQLISSIFENIPPSICDDLLANRLSAVEMQRSEVRAMSIFSESQIMRYFAILRRAMRTEVENDPVATPLSETELQFAQSAYQKALNDVLLSDGPPADNCKTVKLTVDAALQIEGTVGDWVIKLLARQIR